MAAAACAMCSAILAFNAMACQNCGNPVGSSNGRSYENNDHEDDGA